MIYRFRYCDLQVSLVKRKQKKQTTFNGGQGGLPMQI